MIEKLRSFANDSKWIEILFTLLILSFPFGSFFLSVSLGFMTIYPFLVLLCLLTFLGFWKTTKIKSKPERFFLFFLLFFFAYSIAFFPFVDGKADAVIDIRNIALMLMTAYVFISAEKVLGLEKWKSAILINSKIIFVMILLFGFFEMITGFHFVGEFTEKLIERGLDEKIIFNPVFLWDNPNNFNVYIFLIGWIIILLEPAGKQKNILTWLILAICFFISFVVESQVGLMLAMLMAVLIAFYQLSGFLKQDNRPKLFYPILFVVLALGFVVLSKEMFYEIPADKQMKYINYVPKNSPIQIAEVDSSLDSAQVAAPVKIAPEGAYRESGGERMALIKNGIDFTIRSKFIGVGPGQYRYLHDAGKIKHMTSGNNGAHFWLVELLSQYGILIFLLYCGLLFWVLVMAVREWKINSDLSISIILSLICFAGVSVMPSGFLILDINWIFTAILIVVCSNFNDKKTASN